MARFIMMIGIPASGKSKYVNTLRRQGYIISCPDTFRAIFSPSHDEADQSVNCEAWTAAKTLVVESLRSGKNVVLDATEIYPKGRKEFMKNLPKNCSKKAIYIKVKLDTALARNALRGTDGGKRSAPVPDEVIRRMFNGLIEPSVEEGFDEIEIVIND